MSLHGYQAGRQAPAKEFPVEEIKGGSQAGVCLLSRIVHISVLPVITLYRTIQFYFFLEVLSILKLVRSGGKELKFNFLFFLSTHKIFNFFAFSFLLTKTAKPVLKQYLK